MIEILTGLGYGVISLAVMIGIGIVILQTFSSNVASCGTGQTYNVSSSLCTNTTGGTFSPSSASQNINTLNGYLGTSSGGLATWVPIIIVMTIGLAFLGVFLARRGRQS